MNKICEIEVDLVTFPLFPFKSFFLSKVEGRSYTVKINGSSYAKDIACVDGHLVSLYT